MLISRDESICALKSGIEVPTISHGEPDQQRGLADVTALVGRRREPRDIDDRTGFLGVGLA